MAKIKVLIEERYKILVYLFFTVYLAVGISVFKDYGVSLDERTDRNNGIKTWEYACFRNQGLFIYRDRHYGTAFEVVLVAIEKILGLTANPRALYLTRHLIGFLLFCGGVFFFYLLCKHRFRSWKMGLLGALFLILSPRVFAHSFYNPKDAPFLAVFIISIYTMTRYLEKATLSRAVVHAVICALLIGIRITGIIVPFLTFIFLICDLLTAKMPGARARVIIPSLLIYGFSLIYFTVLFWPFLWKNPIYNFTNAFKQASRYPWEGTVLYLGTYVEGGRLPWHYIPVWIIITTPLLYTACFFIGCLTTIRTLLKNPVKFYLGRRDDLIFILWFFLPLVAVIVFRSVLYDGWRHMFFIYPAFLCLSLVGLASLFESIKLKFRGLSHKIITAALVFHIAFSLIKTVKVMIKYHPYQNVYFNLLAGGDMGVVKNNFELDYWGISYRKALEYILRHDRGRTIKVCIDSSAGIDNAYILTQRDRNRLVYVKNPGEANYFLGNYRYHKEEYPYKNEYYSIKINGLKIMGVYKMD